MNEPGRRLIDWWDKLPRLARLLMWPIAFTLSMINVVFAIPETIWFFLRPQQPAEIRLLSREELIRWGKQIQLRFDTMLDMNPPELHGMLQQPRDDVHEMLDAITAHATDREMLQTRADQLADEYSQWKGEPSAEVHALFLHVSKWCDTRNAQ